jgi:hypothetical protein
VTYKILSLDGGGTWALLEALALETIYGDLPGRQILNQFDLVTGNSGGSIVLGGLLADYTPTQLRDLFLKRSSTIFRPLNIFYRAVNAFGFGAKWSTEGKQKGLEDVLGASFASTPMSALAPLTTAKIMIPAFEYERQRAVYFRSYRSKAHDQDCNTRLSDAINASSTAPVAYFDWPSRAADGTMYWDGAIAGYNNPVMAGVIEAMTLGVKPADMRVLTIGTGTYRLLPPGIQPPARPELVAKGDHPTPLGDLKKLAGSITDDPPDAASYTAHVVLGNDTAANPAAGQPPASLVRLSVCLQPKLSAGQWNPPPPLSGDEFKRLGKLELDAIKPDDLRLLEKAGLLWLSGNIDNQPVRPNPTMTSQIGHDTFEDGHAAWRILAGLPDPVPPLPVARP